MKALLLAGGAGTRLRPITHTRAKQLVPVANTPILFYGIEAMAAAGIKEIGVIVGDTGEEVRAALGDGSRFGVTFTFLPQEAPLGLAHCVLIARDFLGDDDFVMYLGDNLLEQDLAAFVDAFEAARTAGDAPVAQILLKRVPDPHRFGIAALDANGHVQQLVEKPADPPSDLALVGVYLFDATVHDAVRAIEPSARGELEITDALQWLIDQGHNVRTVLLSGWWIDTGKLTPLLEANRLLLERIETTIEGEVDDRSTLDGRVIVEAGARIVNSTVRGPVAIGRDTEVVDSFIGPFSAIGAGCRIHNSEIEHSVVMDDSEVSDIPRLEDSLIGREAVVARSQQRPRALRLMVGDHCRIDVE
jgi:glucose-1-phosphate thymidylyltransferase